MGVKSFRSTQTAKKEPKRDKKGPDGVSKGLWGMSIGLRSFFQGENKA